MIRRLIIIPHNIMQYGYWLALQLIYSAFPLMRQMYKFMGFEFNFKDFTQGKLRKDLTFDDLKIHLEELGFEKNRLAWVCKNEVLNLRKQLKDGTQYHIRVFKDRTINGHYEWAPEYAPIRHYFQTMLKPEHKTFKELLGNLMVFK